MRKVGVWIALAALLVNGPRLVIIYLQVDGLRLPLAAEAAILGVTGIATGVVLTGGGMWIAHRLALAQSGALRSALIACWASLLVFAVVLIAPSLVQGVRSSGLADVLTSARLQWAWAITAVVAIEVLAGGSMLASALDPASQERGFSVPQVQTTRKAAQPNTVSLIGAALAKRIEGSVSSAQTVAQLEAPKVQRAASSGEFACRHCERAFATVNARSAHEAKHKRAMASAQA